MKRMVALVLMLVFVFSLVACNDTTDVQPSVTTADTTTSPSSSSTTALDDFYEQLTNQGYDIVTTEYDNGTTVVELVTTIPAPVKTTKPPRSTASTTKRTDGTVFIPTTATTLPTVIPTIPKTTTTATTTTADSSDNQTTQATTTTKPKPNNKTHTYTTGQKHTARPYTERYLYSTLNEEQQGWYRAIYEAISNWETEVSFDIDISADQNYRIYHAVMFDNPEFVCLSNMLSVFSHGDGTSALGFGYTDTKERSGYGSGEFTEELKASCLARQALFDAKVEEIVSTIPADAPDVEKERLIYDYILSNSFYNLHAKWNGFCEDNWCAYGIIVNGYGVCESYSEAFQTLCLRVGLNCTGIVGSAGGGHKWNAIELDGEWYACDVTFDDPIGGEQGAAYHYYFNRTTEWMEESHHSTANSDYPGPKCNGVMYNYQTYYGEE